jgi:hypothetical protein
VWPAIVRATAEDHGSEEGDDSQTQYHEAVSHCMQMGVPRVTGEEGRQMFGRLDEVHDANTDEGDANRHERNNQRCPQRKALTFNRGR